MFDIKLIRVFGGYILALGDKHAHFESKRAAEICLHLIDQKRLPTNRYYLKATERLLSGDEIKTLRPWQPKQKYVNRRRR
jgi:hypothetical protein